MDFDRLRADIDELLAAGNARDAFAALEPALRYPGAVAETARFAEAMELLARVADDLGPEELPPLARAAAGAPDDPEALYGLGWQLVEMGLNGVAATVLARANDRRFGDDKILTELSCALEREGLNADAARVLREATDLVNASFLVRYLLCFNGIMSGGVAEAEALLPRLDSLLTDPERHPFMVATIRGMVARAHAVEGVTALDARDLRGWHYVVTGGLLLHRSPFGFDEGMNGRYAFVQDSPALCLEGLRRVQAVLEAWDAPPARVYHPEDRDSEILARAASTVLGASLAPFDPQATDPAGLVVAYDLCELEARAFQEREAALERFAALRTHRPGQMLWAHASCWTYDAMAAGDLTTYLYQVNATPWGARMGVDPATHAPKELPADDAPPEEIAQRIVSASLTEDALADLDALRALAAAAAQLRGDDGTAAFRAQGLRRRQWAEGPVKSNRFA